MNKLAAILPIIALLLPGVLGAQQTAPEEVRQILERYEETIENAQRIEERLEPVRQRALDGSDGLVERGVGLQQALDEAYRALDDAFDERLARAETLHEEAVRAQETGNHGRVQRLEREAEELRHYFDSLHSEVLGDPAIREQLDRYQNDLIAEMMALDPETDRLLSELDRLNGEIEDLRAELITALAPGDR